MSSVPNFYIILMLQNLMCVQVHNKLGAGGRQYQAMEAGVEYQQENQCPCAISARLGNPSWRKKGQGQLCMQLQCTYQHVWHMSQMDTVLVQINSTKQMRFLEFSFIEYSRSVIQSLHFKINKSISENLPTFLFNTSYI